MPRDNGNSREMRSRIAHLAARLMAVDGVDGYGLAKRKAARQIGAPDTRNLPTDEEVEQALRSYQQLYQADEQRERLAHLRRSAREMMALLSRFNPHLSGPVLSGSAGKYADVDIHLFADSVKDVEMFLIDRQIAYRRGERRLFLGDQPAAIPHFSISTEAADFEVSVFSTGDLRRPLRASAEGRPFDRAGMESVDALLAAT
jgi:hypothetical protein